MDSLITFWAIYSNMILSLGINALLALSIWLTLACGVLSIANAAFMGIGAYAAALFTMKLGTPFLVSLGAGMLFPALAALVIGLPVIRLSGIYLAMATLAFGEVVRVVILNVDSLTGGARGLNGIPQLTQWWHVFLALAIVLFVLWRIKRARIGRAFDAIRSDETAASLMGINVSANELLALVLGAAIAGLAGALDAHLTFFIGPNEYGFSRAVHILTMAILGGITSLVGPVLGSTIITLLPEMFHEFIDFSLIINGAVLVLIVLFLPQGVWDPARFARWRRKGAADHA
ncbi:branched-chain amino acid ABC transporter permease [Castellaniella sp.]|uniref:branched-chain amino acid ABC transporter permease n=1 Tax=Castellaniella sp. TaxID=1955812 RepID=UPI00355E5967